MAGIFESSKRVKKKAPAPKVGVHFNHQNFELVGNHLKSCIVTTSRQSRKVATKARKIIVVMSISLGVDWSICLKLGVSRDCETRLWLKKPLFTGSFEWFFWET